MAYAESKKLKEQRGEVEALQTIIADKWNAEGHKATDEELREYDEFAKQIADLETQIAASERIEARGYRTNSPEAQALQVSHRPNVGNIDTRTINLALKGMLLSQVKPVHVTAEHRNAMARCGFDNGRVECRTFDGMQTDATPGSYLVQEQLRNRVTDAIKAYGGLMSLVTVESVGDGNRITEFVADNTARVATIRSQAGGTSYTNSDYNRKSCDLFMYSDAEKLTIEQIRDSQVDVVGRLTRNLGLSLARGFAGDIVAGAGTTEPFGLLARTTAGATTTTYNAIEYVDLLTMEHSIDPAVRNGGNCKWVFSDSALHAIKSLVDDFNRPLWLPSIAGGAPATVLGYSYVIDNGYGAMGGAAHKVATFGDHSYYKWFQCNDLALTVLNEKYRDTEGAIGYLIEQSAGGDLFVSSNFRPVKHLLTGNAAS